MCAEGPDGDPGQMAPPTPRSGRDPAEHTDDPQTATAHDESGRARGAPYVPPGRDESGQPSPPVPHEGFLGRLATAVLLGQSVVLAVVAVWTFVALATTPGDGPVTVLALRMSLAHAVLLAVTAVLGAAACTTRRWSRRWSVVQFAGYLVVFFVGLTLSANVPAPGWLEFNGPDHALHAVVSLLGFVTAMLLSARLVEPPPGGLPYPTGRTDDPDAEAGREGSGRNEPDGHDSDRGEGERASAG